MKRERDTLNIIARGKREKDYAEGKKTSAGIKTSQQSKGVVLVPAWNVQCIVKGKLVCR